MVEGWPRHVSVRLAPESCFPLDILIRQTLGLPPRMIERVAEWLEYPAKSVEGIPVRRH